MPTPFSETYNFTGQVPGSVTGMPYPAIGVSGSTTTVETIVITFTSQSAFANTVRVDILDEWTGLPIFSAESTGPFSNISETLTPPETLADHLVNGGVLLQFVNVDAPGVEPSFTGSLTVTGFYEVYVAPVTPPGIAGPSGVLRVRREPEPQLIAANGDTPATLTFTTEDVPPLGLRITAYDNDGHLLFSGNIVRTEQFYDGAQRLVAWHVTAIDTWLLNRRRPIGSWTEVDPAEIVDDLFNDYTDHSITAVVEAGLDVITIAFDGTMDFTACLTAVCQAVGNGCAWHKIDTVVYVATTAVEDDPPDPLTDDPTSCLADDPPITLTADLTQVRNRVVVLSEATVTVASAPIGGIGASSWVPIADLAAVSVAGVDNIYGARIQGRYGRPGVIIDVNTTTFLDDVIETSQWLGPFGDDDPLPIPTGTPIYLRYDADDTGAQAALAALEGGDGVHEVVVIFPTPVPPVDGITHIQRMRDVGEKLLASFASPLASIRYDTRDRKTRVGKLIEVDLTAPPIVATLQIQDVTVDQINLTDTLPPRHHVRASTLRQTFSDVLAGGGSSGGGGGSGGGTGLGGSAIAIAAQRLLTARLINGVPFDGTMDITIPTGDVVRAAGLSLGGDPKTTYSNTAWQLVDDPVFVDLDNTVAATYRLSLMGQVDGGDAVTARLWNDTLGVVAKTVSFSNAALDLVASSDFVPPGGLNRYWVDVQSVAGGPYLAYAFTLLPAGALVPVGNGLPLGGDPKHEYVATAWTEVADPIYAEAEGTADLYQLRFMAIVTAGDSCKARVWNMTTGAMVVEVTFTTVTLDLVASADFTLTAGPNRYRADVIGTNGTPYQAYGFALVQQ